MGRRFLRLTLRADELAGYRAAIIACAHADEREPCERLLGQLSSFEARALSAAAGDELAFSPAPGAAELAVRALDQLRRKPLRRRVRA